VKRDKPSTESSVDFGGRNCGVRDSLCGLAGSLSPPDRGFTQSWCQASTTAGRFSWVVLGVGLFEIALADKRKVLRRRLQRLTMKPSGFSKLDQYFLCPTLQLWSFSTTLWLERVHGLGNNNPMLWSSEWFFESLLLSLLYEHHGGLPKLNFYVRF